MRICCGEMGLIRILCELVRLFIALINNGYLVTNKSTANVSSVGLSFISVYATKINLPYFYLKTGLP